MSGEDEGDLGLVVPFFLMSALLEALSFSVGSAFFGVVVELSTLFVEIPTLAEDLEGLFALVGGLEELTS